MVTADELLKSLSTTNSEVEGHVVIGVDRRVTVPSALKRIAVQFDHNVETVVFDCPRYWDGLDMSNMAVYVNYMRSDGYTDSYPVGLVTVDSTDSNIMHFNWTISHNVTAVDGAILFLVCVKKTDSSGYETNHWNSELCQDMYVSPGMEADEQFIEYNQDLVTQLLLRMDTVEKININASEMQSLLVQTTSAKEEAEAARDIAVDESNYIKNSYANAIKGNAKGETIRVDDVSPIEHNVRCNVYGKNLCPTNEFDGSNSDVRLINNIGMRVQKGYTYTFSCSASYVNEGAADKRVQIIYSSDATQESVYDVIHQISTSITDSITKTGIFMKTFVASVTGYVYIRIVASKVFILENIQFEEGSVATEYEPHVDPTMVTVTASGKNLIPYPYTNGETKTTNGITFTVNADKSIKAKGTATADAFFNLSQKDFNNVGFTRTDCSYDSGNKYAYISISRGMTVDKTFYPQIEVGTVSTEWEPPTERIDITPSPDGTVNITSISPTMTIFTDTPGVIIKAEYNRDTTKAMTSYIWTDEIKDEIASKVESDMAEVLASLNSYAESLIGGGS